MHDEQFGLVYNRNRYLDPRTGRWVQRDPAGYVDGTNPYQYVGSQPTVAVDTSGQKLCFRNALFRNRQRFDSIVAALDAITGCAVGENIEGDPKENACCIVAEAIPQNTLPQRLVYRLAKAEGHTFWFAWGRLGYHPQQKLIRYSDAPLPGRRLVKYIRGRLARIAWGVNDRQRGVRLAHEMIHAYYMTLKGHGRTLSAKPLTEQYLWFWRGREWLYVTPATDQTTTSEEEAYTVGLTIVTGFTDRNGDSPRGNLKYPLATVALTQWDAEFTENKILRSLGFPFARAVYSGTINFERQAFVVRMTKKTVTRKKR